MPQVLADIIEGDDQKLQREIENLGFSYSGTDPVSDAKIIYNS
jgi:hypothetical protein